MSKDEIQFAVPPHFYMPGLLGTYWTVTKVETQEMGTQTVTLKPCEMTDDGERVLLDQSQLQVRAHANSKEKGWWRLEPGGGVDPDPETIAAKLALVHNEVSEALECVRDGDMRTLYRRPYPGFDARKPEGFPTELADIVIRVMDLAEATGVDLGAAILEKMDYNETRPYKHGGKRL